MLAAMFTLGTLPSVFGTPDSTTQMQNAMAACQGLQGNAYQQCLTSNGFYAALNGMTQSPTNNQPSAQFSKDMVGATAQCHGLTGDALTACLQKAGAGALLGGVNQSFNSLVGFNPAGALEEKTEAVSNWFGGFKSMFNNVKKTGKAMLNTTLGRQDLADIADAGAEFLGNLAWFQWGNNSQAPFPLCLATGGMLYQSLNVAIPAWKKAVLNQGIPPSSPTRAQQLNNIGYTVLVNQKNLTIIKGSDGTGQNVFLRKTPWGWLPCSSDGQSILSSTGQLVPISQINKTIAAGTLVPWIWIKPEDAAKRGGESRMEKLSKNNCDLLAVNNLGPFMTANVEDPAARVN